MYFFPASSGGANDGRSSLAGDAKNRVLIAIVEASLWTVARAAEMWLLSSVLINLSGRRSSRKSSNRNQA